MQSETKIIFFDGYCNLCNSFVDFIFRVDHKNIFYVASLQGETAKKLLPFELIQSLKTVVYHDGQNIHTESTAVLTILKELGGAWSWTQVLFLFPRALRDAVYFIVSHYRYLIFGKRETCRLPTEAEKKRFLP